MKRSATSMQGGLVQRAAAVVAEAILVKGILRIIFTILVHDREKQLSSEAVGF